MFHAWNFTYSAYIYTTLNKMSNGNHSTSNEHVHDQRRTIRNQKSLEEKYSFNDFQSDNALKGAINYGLKYYKPNSSCMRNYFFKRIPFCKWIIHYDLKQNLAKDILAGLTIGKKTKGQILMKSIFNLSLEI